MHPLSSSFLSPCLSLISSSSIAVFLIIVRISCFEIGSRWQSRRICAHLLLQEHGNCTSCWETIDRRMLEPTKKAKPHPKTRAKLRRDGRRGTIKKFVLWLSPEVRYWCSYKVSVCGWGFCLESCDELSRTTYYIYSSIDSTENLPVCLHWRSRIRKATTNPRSYRVQEAGWRPDFSIIAY